MEEVHLPSHKKKAYQEQSALIFEDEASFRQDSTLHRTWAHRGQRPLIPMTGQRYSIKIFGCVEIFSARFLYQRDQVFNAQTYLGFLESIATAYYPRKVLLIQDNAPYHKDGDVWTWFKENRKWLSVYNLPPYSPEDNAAEPLWRHTRINATHNRYFKTEDEILDSLTMTFRDIQKNPDQIRGYLAPFL